MTTPNPSTRRTADSRAYLFTVAAHLVALAAFPPAIASGAPEAGAVIDLTAASFHQRVSAVDRASEIGYFGTCPESPDGKRIAYVLYDGRPSVGGPKEGSGGLYLCDVNLTHHVKIRDIDRIRWEDGAAVIWLDNDSLAYLTYESGDVPVTYVVSASGKVLSGPIEGFLGHGDAPGGSVAMSVDKRQYPKGSKLGSNGIYLYKGGAVTKIVDTVRDFGPLKDQMAGNDDARFWNLFHAQLSPEGIFLSIRLDTEMGKQYLLTCRTDGSDVRFFGQPRKPLHQQWFDDSTIFGQEFVAKPADGGPRFRGKRWDRDGKELETIFGVGNHPGISPDRKFVATDNQYELDPVTITLYRIGSTQPIALLMRESPGPVWKLRTHVNPAFSRDGRWVYFNKPVNGVPQVHRVSIERAIHAKD